VIAAWLAESSPGQHIPQPPFEHQVVAERAPQAVLIGRETITAAVHFVRAGPGMFFAAPPGVRHGFAIPGPAPARFLNIHAPGTGFIDGVRRQSR
jgi:hypothetical protein